MTLAMGGPAANLSLTRACGASAAVSRKALSFAFRVAPVAASDLL